MEERLNMLEMGGVIDGETKAFGLEVFSKIEKEYTNQHSIETFITHLVMAIERIKSGEIVSCDAEDMAKNIMEDVGEEQYQRSLKFKVELLENSPVEFPKEEMAFIILHLNSVMSQV